MGVSFDGTTSSTRWLVVDVANDPLGHPNSEVGADPARPYVSISIAHGIRRFEFMIHADESDEEAEDPAFVIANACAAGPVPGARRRDPAPGLHPPLAHRGGVPPGTVDAGRRRRPSDAGVAGPGLQQRHPRRGQPRLEARGRGERPRRRRIARHLRRRAAQTRARDDRPVHDGRPGHLADESPGRRTAGPCHPRRVGRCPR